MGLCTKFCLIYSCLSTVIYFILLNGSPFGSFQLKQSLRQEDPLSPYLFIIVVECLSRLIDNVGRDNLIHRVRITRHSLYISHLLYVDELIIIVKTNRSQYEIFHSILQKCL